MAGTLGAASVASMAAVPARAVAAVAKSREIGRRVTSPIIQRYQAYQTRKEEIKRQYRY